MRIRTVALCSLAVGATWFWSNAASALDVGPVTVPVTVPPAVTVTVSPDAIAPLPLPVSELAPGTDASVTVSPATGVDASVSLPSSLGPVAVLPGAPHDVQVGIATDGAGVTLSSGSAPIAGEPGIATGGPGSESSSAGAVAPRSAAARTASDSAVLPSSRDARAANAVSRGHRAVDPSSLPVEPQPGAVNASLEHHAAGGVWSLLHDLASARGLWIALLLIVAVARFAAGGLLRDAFRRRAQVTSA